ncbi:CHAP domain-containing protein [Salinithrix halophila]|uniref:CHAP domain-containing protein n=1 Tax=Salinithrix halophila TaxID=1485204 RepID=A0ABV8JFZ6_9BACL
MNLLPYRKGGRFWTAVLLTAILIAGVLQPGRAHGEGTDNKKKELEGIRDQKGAVREELKKLEKKIRPQKEKVVKMEGKIEKANRKISEVEKEQKKNEKRLEYYDRLFKNRIRIIYQNGEMGNMQSLLKAGSIEEFLARFQTLRLILLRDRSLMEKYERIRDEKKALKEKYEGLAKEQQEEAEKARKIYVKVEKEIRKTEKKLAGLNQKEETLREALNKLSLVDATLYPFKFASTVGVDAWGFYNRQCTSFVAWRMNQHGKRFANTMGGGRWGNATNWDNNARRLGYRVNRTPRVGAIAQWDAGNQTGGFGHVAYVTAVKGSSVTVEEYNYNTRFGFGRRTVSAGSVSNYIHLN